MKKSRLRWIILGIAIIASIILVMLVQGNQPLAIDTFSANFITGIFGVSTHPFFEFISVFGDKIGVGIIVLMMIIWLWFNKRNYLAMAILILSVAIGNELSKVVKELVGRERPTLGQETAETLSFPSGHAMVGIILYSLVAYFFIRASRSNQLKWVIGLAAMILVLLIGVSRVVLGAHYITDILGGYTLGIVWTILWVFLYEILTKRFVEK
jgi:undecaprenyl-diphosphatase